MDVTEFNNIFNNLLKKINQEQKTVFLLGDFNIDLMHYNEHKSHFKKSATFGITRHIQTKMKNKLDVM